MMYRPHQRRYGADHFVEHRSGATLTRSQVSQIGDGLEGVVATAATARVVQKVLEVHFVPTLQQVDVGVGHELVPRAAVRDG